MYSNPYPEELSIDNPCANIPTACSRTCKVMLAGRAEIRFHEFHREDRLRLYSSHPRNKNVFLATAAPVQSVSAFVALGFLQIHYLPNCFIRCWNRFRVQQLEQPDHPSHGVCIWLFLACFANLVLTSGFCL